MDNFRPFEYQTSPVFRSPLYTSYFFGLMVIFGPSVFYLFGPLVIFSVVRFSIYSVHRIWPYGPVHLDPQCIPTKCLKFFEENEKNSRLRITLHSEGQILFFERLSIFFERKIDFQLFSFFSIFTATFEAVFGHTLKVFFLGF